MGSHLVEAVGPMGKMILDDVLKEMGGFEKALEPGRIRNLIDRLASEISNEDERRQFVDALKQTRSQAASGSNDIT